MEFNYYVVNKNTWFIVAGFDSAADANRFKDVQLHAMYRVVTSDSLAEHNARRID